MTAKKKTTLDSTADDKWVRAAETAKRTATWAKTMTKVLISQSTKSQPRWHVINFLGPNKSEARGIVDLVAIRRNQQVSKAPLKRGDLFEIVLLQVKGGSARWPSAEDRERLRAVKDAYFAREVLLSEWKQGAKAKLYRLSDDEWIALSDPADVFCPTAKASARKKAKQLISVPADTATLPGNPRYDDLPNRKRQKSQAALKAWATRRLRSAGGE